LNGLVGGNFVTRAIYFDKLGRKWVSINGTGLLVQKTDGSWKKINYPKIFPASPFFITMQLVVIQVAMCTLVLTAV
jgi:hypothetical protein